MNDHPFRAFINLIEHDQEIRTIRFQINQVEHAIQLLQEQEKKLTQEFDAYKEHVKQIRKKVDELELEMKELDTKEQLKKKQLDQTSNSKEYQALKKEITQLKYEQHAKEEALLSQWNQLDAALKELKTKQASYDQEVSSIHEQMQAQLKLLQELQSDVNKREHEREEKERIVPTEWLEKYSHMRTQTADPVVPVMSGSCGACFTTITEQEILRLMRRALVQCKGCFRLMYMQEAWK